MANGTFLKILEDAARGFARRHQISAVKVQFLLVGIGVVLLAVSTTMSIVKVRSGYEEAVAEYKSTLWYATQIEFEFSRFLNALDVMGTGDTQLGATDAVPRFQVLKRRLPALVRGIQNNAGGESSSLNDGVSRLSRILDNIEEPLRSLRQGDIRTYLQIRSEVESGLAPLRGVIAEAQARGENEFEGRQERIAPFFSDMFLYAVGTFIGGIVLILILIRQIRHTHRAMAKVEQAQREMAAAKEEAEAADRAKSHFLAVMSHEIRTPMNGVLGMASLLSESRLTDQQREYLETIRGSGEALLTILNDILDFSKLEVGRVDLEEARFDPADIAEDAASLFATAAHEKGIEIAVALDPDLPSAVMADPGRLRQVLLNLVGNAVKFTEVGGVILSAVLERRAGGAEAIRFDIADTGIGVPEQRRNVLFEEFRQADPSVSRRFGGTGLGLAICKRLVELMGGDIGYRPNQANAGNGSVFSFTLPVREGAAPPVPAAPIPGLGGRRALVVCDNPILARDVVNHLAPYGVDVLTERDPAAVPARLSEAVSAGEAFDLLLADAQLPGFQAESFAGQISASGNAPILPAVLILPTSGAVTGEMAEADGFAGNLRKPLRRREVHHMLRRVLLGEEEAETPSERETPPAPAAPVPVGRYRLLLAEDGRVNQAVAMAMLERAGYEVDIAGDGISALHALEARPYDLVLMDIHMPEADGFQATAAIRSLGNANANVPIIAMTANALADNRQACLDAGMNSFLTKPINRDEMLQTIAAELSGSGRSPPAPPPPDAAIVPVPAAEDDRPLHAATAIDADIFMQFGRDVGFDCLSLLIDEFVAEARNNIAQAREAADADRNEEAGRLVHSVKSSAGTIGASRLESCAAEIESLCFAAQLDGIGEAFDRMEAEAEQAIADLPVHLRAAVSAEDPPPVVSQAG